MDKFKKQAIALGLCQEWQDKWEETGLVDKYINGITWCMKNEFPALKDMRKFDDAMLRNGIYNEKKVDITCNRDTYVFNASEGNFTISGYAVCRIYVGRGSKLKITVKDHAILFVDNYDSTVEIVKDKTAKCTVWNKTVAREQTDGTEGLNSRINNKFILNL